MITCVFIRCVNGLTLLHCAVKLGSMDAIKVNNNVQYM